MMNRLSCMFERVSNFGVGMALLLFGLGFVVIGITILPVIGLFVAAPVLVLSAVFFIAHRSKECQITLNG